MMKIQQTKAFALKAKQDYELINTTTREIYLSTPKLEHTASKSYFTTLPVSIVVEYLGRE